METKHSLLHFGIPIFVAAIFLIGAIFYERIQLDDRKLHIVFCNVGQGDAIFIKTPNNTHILVDGGPDDSVLSCLQKHMPFWERRLAVVVLTHPHADHLNGLIPVLKQYEAGSFAIERLSNDTVGFQTLFREVASDKITLRYVSSSDRFRLSDGTILQVAGPSKEFLEKTSPKGKIGESKEFGSLITLISYGSFQALLTGDSQADELQQAISLGSLTSLSVLQVPHHGSKTGIDSGNRRNAFSKGFSDFRRIT